MSKNHQVELLKLAFPIILGNLSQMMLNIIDSAMVGQLGYKYLAAAALVNNMIGLPFVLCIGFTVAISPLVAELKGAQKEETCGNLLNNAFYLNMSISILLVSILYFTGGIIYYLKQDQEVANMGRPYLNWMLWSIVPMIAFLSIKQFCDGLNHTKIPMILSLASIPFNAILNYALIYGNWGFPSLNIEGAGIATFITRLLMAIILGAFVLDQIQFKKYNLQNRLLKKEVLNKIAKLAIPSSWQYVSEIGAFVILGIMVGWFGAIQQAAHQVALSVAALTFMVSIGLSSAGSIKVGEAYGMQNIHLARKTGISVLQFASIYGILCAIAFILFRNYIPYLFSSEQEVVRQASILFLFAAAFQLGDSIQAVGIGILRGIQDVKLPTLYTTLCYWFLGIPVGYLLSVTLNWQVIGVWVAFIVCLSVMAVLLYRRFLSITKEFKYNTPS
ncbi:MAG: MATE family efflux transporter [Saprospiraceae bacterium]|nr:MATE family efflux transporter [Saprospiraceae bacterium]MBK9221738.1 MATE family efflux transporter [Saprospiraceae bacterium]MBK9721325.1 MATE family efflux transporter [Saprospiraceae bacterium]MBK9728336.1 MATE family efflux transporter [Saprospiraceae bacterium]